MWAAFEDWSKTEIEVGIDFGDFPLKKISATERVGRSRSNIISCIVEFAANSNNNNNNDIMPGKGNCSLG
jgi:hypothetical protein